MDARSSEGLDCNLKQKEGFKCKIGGLEADLQLEFENQGPRCKICKGLGLRVHNRKAEGLLCKSY
jgi:hypothetical protein